jgi:hypothetical protein
MKGQPQTQYKMTLRNIDGLEVDTCLGTLKYVSDYLGEHSYTFIDGYFDNYHKLRRELLRARGAYSCYYPAGDRPLLLTILEQKFVPAPGRESDESIALRNMPLLPSVARVIENQNKLAREAREAERVRPITSDCANCGTSVPILNGQGYCPYCIDMFSEKPSPITVPSHSHPTLSWEQMSKWQRKNYAIKS